MENFKCCGIITPTGHYEPCGSTHYSAAAIEAHLPGCMVTCEEHLVVSNKERGETIEQIIDWYQQARQRESARIKKCAICGSHNATWNTGAGRDLCNQHWNEY